MSEQSFADGPMDTDTSEEEIEPKLKYLRLGADVATNNKEDEKVINTIEILSKHSASSITVHSKFICLGVHRGNFFILDHKGHDVRHKRLEDSRLHTLAINQISVDLKGEYVATCSDDGKIFIQDLNCKENNQCLNLGKMLKTIALDPYYFKGRRFITGDEKLTLHEKTFFGLRSTVLCESEGYVRSLCWGENFVAWASDIGVRVYDINARCSLGLIKWEQHPGISIEKFRCNLRWADSRTLLIGWVDTVRVCIIRKRSGMELGNRDLPEYLVDPVSTFQTDYYISGIAPLDHQLVLLGFPKELDEDNKSLRPQLYIVEYHDNDSTEVCTDSLSLRGYRNYTVNEYHLEVLIEENRFFIVAPKDIVIASPFDLDDRIQWLIQHKKFEEALKATESSREVRKFTKENVGIIYLDFLLAAKRYAEAGLLCQRICGRNNNLWLEQIIKFATAHQLRSVSAYIPTASNCKLDNHIYKMVLYEYIQMDPKGFLKILKEWDPQLYDVGAVIKAIKDQLQTSEKNKNIYCEALALLYSYIKEYESSIALYLTLKNDYVFTLIQKHDLYDYIYDKIVDLMVLDHEKAIALFTDKKRGIPAELVVQKLSNHGMLLYQYLDYYHQYDTMNEYHGHLVKLYAIHNREKLLPLLKSSDNYPLQETLEICQKLKYYKEMVFLLGRIGDAKEALELIMKELKNIEEAVKFCQEQNDPELWNDLINHSMDNPEYITFLLQSLGTYVDPTILIQKIEAKKEIPGLKNSLVKMLCTYNLQVSVQEGCKKILVSDYFNLHSKLVRTQQKGHNVCEETICAGCYKPILRIDMSRADVVVVFNCKHCFHQRCLDPEEKDVICGICHKNYLNVISNN